MPEYAQPYAFDLTPSQHELLLGLVMRAADDERARAERMAARPAGTHTPAVIDAATVLRHDLRELEAAIRQAPITEPEPETLDEYIESGKPVPQRFRLGTVGDALGGDEA